MSLKLKYHQNCNVTNTEISPKRKYHQNTNITKTETSPKQTYLFLSFLSVFICFFLFLSCFVRFCLFLSVAVLMTGKIFLPLSSIWVQQSQVFWSSLTPYLPYHPYKSFCNSRIQTSYSKLQTFQAI